MPDMVEELDPFFLIMWHAQGQRADWLTVHMTVTLQTVHILKMLLSTAHFVSFHRPAMFGLTFVNTITCLSHTVVLFWFVPVLLIVTSCCILLLTIAKSWWSIIKN